MNRRFIIPIGLEQLNPGQSRQVGQPHLLTSERQVPLVGQQQLAPVNDPKLLNHQLLPPKPQDLLSTTNGLLSNTQVAEPELKLEKPVISDSNQLPELQSGSQILNLPDLKCLQETTPATMAFLAPLLPAMAASLISTLTGTALRKIIGDAPNEDIVELAATGLDSRLGQAIVQNPEAMQEWQVKMPQWQRELSQKMSLEQTQDQPTATLLVPGQDGKSTSPMHHTPAGSLLQESTQQASINQQPSHLQTAINPQILQPQRAPLPKEMTRSQALGQASLMNSQSLAPLRSAQPYVSPESQMIMPRNDQIQDSKIMTPTLSENTVRYAANMNILEGVKDRLKGLDMVAPALAPVLPQTHESTAVGAIIKDNLKELGREVASGVGRSLINTLTGRQTRSDRLRNSVPYTVRSPGRVQITEVTDDAVTPAITQKHVPAILPSGYIERDPQTLVNQGNQPTFPKPYSFDRFAMGNRWRSSDQLTSGEAARKASIGRSISDVLKQAGKDAIGSAFSSAAQFALRKIIGDSPTGMVKVVGDAPIPTGSVALENADPSNKTKVVGDAPTDELGGPAAKKMDSEAAGGADKSTLMRYMSILQLLEQTLTIDSCSDWSSYDAYLTGISNNFRHILAEYDTTSISVMTQFWGSAFLPTIINAVQDDHDVGDAQACLFYCAFQWKIEPTYAVSSPPVLSTTDMSSLLTATRGGVITEFSSAMRLNLSVFSSESMAYLVHLIADMVVGSNGYSFIDPLLRLLLTIESLYPIPGSEASEWWYGIHWVENRHHARDDFWARDEIFPIHQMPRRDGIDVAVVTYEQFILRAAGKTTAAWRPEWDVSTWNDTTGIVFLKNEDRSDALKVVAKMISVIEYPLYSFAMRMDARCLDTVAGWIELGTLPGFDVHHLPVFACIPVSGAVYIPGPRKNVLFVLLDARGLNAGDIALILPEQGDLAVADYGPANYELNEVMGSSHPFVAPPRVDNSWVPWECFAMWRDRDIMTAAMQREIANWERDFGNTSDRSQALRLTANFAQAFGPTKQYNRARPNTGDPVTRSTTVMATGLSVTAELHWPEFYNVPWVSTQETFTQIESALILTTDGCGLFPHFALVGHGTVSPIVSYMSACNFDIHSPYAHYTIGRRNSLIELAVLKNLITVSEELPGNLLSTSITVDVAVMKMMGQIMSQTSDVIHQELCVDWFTKCQCSNNEMFLPAADVNHIGLVSNLLNSSLKRSIDWILSFGIQFPQIQNDYFSASLPIGINQAAHIIYDGALLIYPAVSRIPVWAHKNSGRVFDISTNTIDFTQGLINRASTHFSLNNDGTYPAAAHMNLYDDLMPRHPEADSVTISAVRLTVAEIPTVLSNNPVVFLTAHERKNFSSKLGYPFVAPDASLANSLALSPWNENIVLAIGANFRPLPSGYIVPNVIYNWADLASISVYNGADKDMFLGGSANWKVFTVPQSVADRLTATIPDLPDFQVFGDVNALFSY